MTTVMMTITVMTTMATTTNSHFVNPKQ